MSKKLPRTKKKVATKNPPAPASAAAAPTHLDLGCGGRKKEGFYGVDQFKMEGVDLTWDLGDRTATWPFADGSIHEVSSSHFFEHLSQDSRVWFMNELHRVLIPNGKAIIVTPYWASSRAYGDPTHTWPPIGEMTFYYFNRDWRLLNAPHADKQWNPLGFDCDFDFGTNYSLHPELTPKNEVTQRFEAQWYKEAVQDIIGVLTKKAPPQQFK